MEKFAVDLDKVLDEFELNEDNGYANENVKNRANGPGSEVISSNYGYHNTLSQPRNLKNSTAPYSYHDGSSLPSLVTQNVDNIDLDDADFAPSSKTTSNFYQQEKFAAVKSDHNEQYKSPLHESNNQFSSNGINNWTKFVTVSNHNNLNEEVAENDVIEKIKVSENHHKEPDVIQVSVTSKQNSNLSSTEDDAEQALPNGSSDVVQTLPDVMVISSNALIEEDNLEAHNIVADSLNCNNSSDNAIENRLSETVIDNVNVCDESAKDDDVKSSLESDISTMSSNSSNFHSLDMSSSSCPDQPQSEASKTVTEVEIHPNVPSDGKGDKPVGFTKDENVSENELNKYFEELEQLENNEEGEDGDQIRCDVDKVEDEQENGAGGCELPVEKKNTELEGSMKRHIDQIDGFIYNTGARPKKLLMYNEKLFAKREPSSESLDKLNNFKENKSSNQSSEIKVINAAVSESQRSDDLLDLDSQSLDQQQQKSLGLSNTDNANILPSEEYHSNVQFQENTANAMSNASARRQRPTSLNLPPRFNIGLPKIENVDVAPKRHSSGPDSHDFMLPTQSQNNELLDSNFSQPAVQRPSRLPVGNPLNTLMNNVVQPPGHTPGHVLGIPDLCHQLENSSPVPDDSTPTAAASPSPSISSESGCSISPSPVDSTAKAWPTPSAEETSASSPVTSTSTEDQQLGRVAPFWVPDSCSRNCMLCDVKFTVIKRRHHCRACGKVLCWQCCNLTAKIQYMDYKDARVCQPCCDIITRVNALKKIASPESSSIAVGQPTNGNNNNSADGSLSSGTPSPSIFRGRSPNPNNPDEYCSTVPPLQQAQAALQQPPPTVMVPVGVLKREGSKVKGEPKQVIFSDGIRPGGDLTELDGSSEPFIPTKKPVRTQKKVIIGSASQNKHGSHTKANSSPDSSLSVDNSSQNSNGLNNLECEEQPDIANLMDTIKDESLEPVSFYINKNLAVLIKIVTLDCCVNKICWCFTTKGMCTIGQDEVVIVLECLPDETTAPIDIFRHLSYIYDEALKGNVVADMGHSLVTQTFLGSKEHGGFLFIKPTFQCLNKLVLPPAPYIFGILLEKWEAPWAKVFPLRLMLRLGAEFRYYPCPLISVRFRKPVFCEIGHTIMNVLADFRNYQYGLPSVRGMVTVMEDKKTFINFPRNRYDEVMKALNNSNDHVLALSSNFSMEADSHLVCVQNDEGHYQTQAINIQNKARKVTGASFVVFNGALKSSSGLSAKSSIVEDGLMVQISSETMLALRQSLRDMKDFTIGCGPINVPEHDEVVLVQWVDDDKGVNAGVKSVVDKMEFDGIQSIRIHSGTDYMGDNKLIRWTEVFLIKTGEEGTSTRMDPINISRLSETLAQACCIALTPHLDQLKDSDINKIGLRVTINSEKVEYEVGANGEKLPDFYMNDLDSELVPVIHRAVSNNHEGLVVLELVFYILEY